MKSEKTKRMRKGDKRKKEGPFYQRMKKNVVLFSFHIIILSQIEPNCIFDLIHGTYIRWSLRNRCAHKKQYLLLDLFMAFD